MSPQLGKEIAKRETAEDLTAKDVSNQNINTSSNAEIGETIVIGKTKEINKKAKKQEHPVKKSQKKKLRALNWTIIICLLIIMIPFAVLGWIIYSAQQGQRAPISGSRFAGQLQPELTSQDNQKLQDVLKGIDGVESVTVETKVSTTRIMVNTLDEYNNDQLLALSKTIYEKINETYPIDKYFTNTETIQMYDLELTLYNNLEYTLDQEPYFAQVVLIKNGYQENPITQVVSKPKNAEVAQSALNNVEERKKAEEEAQKAKEESQDNAEGDEAAEGEQENTESNEG